MRTNHVVASSRETAKSVIVPSTMVTSTGGEPSSGARHSDPSNAPANQTDRSVMATADTRSPLPHVLSRHALTGTAIVRTLPFGDQTSSALAAVVAANASALAVTGARDPAEVDDVDAGLTTGAVIGTAPQPGRATEA